MSQNKSPIRRFGSVVYPPGGAFSRPRQEWLQLVMVHTGEVQVTQNRTTFTVPGGWHFFMIPGCAYVLRFSTRRSTRHSWIDTALAPPPELATVRRRPGSRPMGAVQERLIETIMGFTRAEQDSLQPFFCDLCEAFVRQSLRQWKTPLPTSTPSMSGAVDEAMAWMQEQLPQALTLESIAEEVGLSREHLVRSFQKQTGQTPMNWLWDQRLARARELLAHTGLSIEQVASQCGFVSLPHFTRRFKASTSYPPARFRERSSGGVPPFPKAP